MRFRKLRIAFSVTCGIACVLLITVWKMGGGTYIGGYFPGVPQFRVTSYCFGENHWHDTVSAYVMFGLHSRDDSEWKVGRFIFEGILPEGFAISIDAGRSEITVDASHWFLVLFCASLAAIPWTPIVFGVPRFSLRTLLVATTLVALLLGMIVWVSK